MPEKSTSPLLPGVAPLGRREGSGALPGSIGPGGCVDPSSDARSCGGCDSPCAAPAPFCSDGACGAVPCDELATPARGCGVTGAGCVPEARPVDHPLHCGGCDVRCAADEICVGGVCSAYVPMSACQACPCAACAGALCCDSEEIGAVICLDDSPSCPR